MKTKRKRKRAIKRKRETVRLPNGTFARVRTEAEIDRAVRFANNAAIHREGLEREERRRARAEIRARALSQAERGKARPAEKSP